jgi:hypothetical protein
MLKQAGTSTEQEIDQSTSGSRRSANFSAERIAELAGELTSKMGAAIGEISTINTTARLLSLNAQIEAARAGGSAGAAFAVVASAMQDLSERTGTVANNMAAETSGAIEELDRISKLLATNVRGTRLSDLALTNINLIDRNLYERSCDVRWWAADLAAVGALSEKTPQACKTASKRFAVILNAYTVYFDLVLCDLQGNVIANGRADKFASVGINCRNETWFKTALATRSGDEFGFQGAHVSNLVSGQRALIYSCGVRANADARGKMLGVLGVVFNWDGLAQKIVTETPLNPGEEKSTRVCIVDKSGRIIADSHDKQLTENLNFPEREMLFSQKKSFILADYNGDPCCIAHGLSPGFETYATGWHSVIIQRLNDSRR